MARLLILCEYPTLLGGECSMLATLPSVIKAGLDVTIACPAKGPLQQAVQDKGINILPWNLRNDHGQRLPLEVLRTEFASIISKHQPDLVHANSLSMARLVAPVTKTNGISSLGHLRDIIKLSKQMVSDLNELDQLIAVSTATRDYHVAQGVLSEQCLVVSNGVNLTQFAPRPSSGYLHRELGLPGEAQFIATIGQIGLRKGTDIAMQVMNQVIAEFREVHWLVVGERTSEKEEARQFEAVLRRESQTSSLAGHVHFLGTRSDIPTLLCECKFLLHTARQEPLGRVLLEAAAAGLPVVATDVGGTREIFTIPADGALLVGTDNVTQIANVASKLMTDTDLRKTLAEGARHRVGEQFNIERTAARLVDVYRQMMN